MKLLLTLALATLTAIPTAAQPDNSGFHDTYLMKPPAGAKVAVYAFEDLECPACAHAFPIVQAACRKNNVPFLNRDFLIPSHIWSPTAALHARYLEDKVSPALSIEYRHDLFAAQSRIASKDDLASFTRKWFQAHGQNIPFLLDPNDALRKEVLADGTFGLRVGVHRTPTFFVVTEKSCTNVENPEQIDQTIQAALSQLTQPTPRIRHK